MAQRTLYVEHFQQFLNCLVFEFISAVCVEQSDIFKTSFNALKGCFYKLCRFIFSCTLTYDFPVIKVHKHTYVIPACTYSYICQITYHHIPVSLPMKLPA